MVNKQVVIDTIKKMVSSGIEEAVIKKTLADIGLSAEEVNTYIAEVKVPYSSSSPTPSITSRLQEVSPLPSPPTRSSTSFQNPAQVTAQTSSEEIAQRAAEKIQEHLSTQQETKDLQESSLHNAMDYHGQKIEDVQQNVSSLHSKFDTGLTDPNLLKELASLTKKVNDFDQQLSDLKSLANATKTILEKILETDREILKKL